MCDMNQLHCANCVDFMATMKAESVDMTLTSPPYDDLRDYNGYTFDFEAIAKQLFRITKQGGVVVWVVGDKVKNGNESGTSFRQALYFQEIGFNLFDTMIYAKTPRGAVGSSNHGYLQCFEYMFIISKGIPKTRNLLCDRPNSKAGKKTQKHHRNSNGKQNYTNRYTIAKQGKRTNIWEYPIGNNLSTKDKIAFQHPAIFPEKLAEDHILSWSNEGDLVFDPMCGSGTTGKMALKHNRKFIGVDISQEYIDIAEQRLNPPQQKLL